MRTYPLSLGLLLFISFPLISCSPKSQNSRIPALFESKAAAERAAKDFNCQGAHKMGNKWMPCEKHSDHHQH